MIGLCRQIATAKTLVGPSKVGDLAKSGCFGVEDIALVVSSSRCQEDLRFRQVKTRTSRPRQIRNESISHATKNLAVAMVMVIYGTAFTLCELWGKHFAPVQTSRANPICTKTRQIDFVSSRQCHPSPIYRFEFIFLHT